MAVLQSTRESVSHWYDQQGVPVHRLPTPNGKTRPTTLRDARKLHLLPSVTNVLGLLAKPGLDRWKAHQVALAALRIPRDDGESDDQYVTRLVEGSYEVTDKAAGLGSRIHRALDGHWHGRDIPPDLVPYVEPTVATLRGFVRDVIATERVLINQAHGFGGTTDLVVTTLRGNRAVLDFKCRRTEKGRPVEWYPEQLLQIAAYAATAFGEEDLPRVHGANILISSTEPGRVEVKHYLPDRLVEGFTTFSLICDLWRRLKEYDPRAQ